MASSKTVIFHLDLDSFFVSAERLRDPSLRGRCMAVGGDGRRGVIASASYEARKFGVRSAMPTAQALRLCRHLVLVEPHFELYSRLSRQVFKIVERFAPIHEQVGVDEGYLDMTGTETLYGTPLEAAARIRAAIRAETGLSASVGIASNRLVAKVASDFCKPDNLIQVESGKEAEFLAPLAVGKLPGCGPKTQAALAANGIHGVGELQRRSVQALERQFGGFGRYLHDSAWGRGSTAFNEEAKTRTSSKERTYSRDEGDPEKLRKEIWSMCSELGTVLREEGVFARAVRLKLRYPPFETLSRSRVMDPVENDDALFKAAWSLFEESWDPHRPLRLIGVGFVHGAGERQLGLFENPRDEQRQQAIDRLKDEFRKKFGDRALRTGRDLDLDA
jgi:DNA polymerase-4